MKRIIFGVLILVMGGTIVSACQGKASEISTENIRYKILEKWELPKALDEISGIAWIGNNRIACVQDEDGIIFIYNLESSKIEEEIEFGEGGDYEGLAVIGDDAYVLRSDGVITEVSGFMEKNPRVKNHVTGINSPGINLEGLCADPNKQRLLLAVKDRKGSSSQKEVFEANLNQLELIDEPLFNIDFSDPIFRSVHEKEKFMPGEIEIHPKSGEIYILDGSEPKILITEKNGTSKELFILGREDFENPEGLTFSPKGDLYISNEAENSPANILKVVLDRKSP